MVSHAKSIKQQNDKTVNHGPASIWQSITDNYQKIFLYALGKQTTHKDSCYATQETIASDLGISPKTVQRATHFLEDMGLFYVQRRRKTSSVIVVPQIILQNERWRGFLRGICAWIPPIVLHLSLLSSSGSICDRLLRSGSGKDSSINVVLNTGVTMGNEAQPRRATPDAIKINEVKRICAALIRLGSYMTNDLALGFLAFDVDVLERASQKMRERKNIESPAAYFNTLCREITIQDGRRPDWVTVHKLRESGLVLIEKANEVPVIERPTRDPASAKATAGRAERPPKQEQQATSYTEQVRKSMEEERRAAEARKTIHAPFEEELAALDKQIEQLRPRAEGNMVLTATLNWQLRCREELIAKHTPNTPQISTKTKEVVSSPSQVGSWKQIDPIANLASFPSRQKEQAVNLSAMPSEVQILPTPPIQSSFEDWNPIEADELYDPDQYEE